MSQRPNILFFLPDQHRPDWLPMNPDLPLRMPNLARIAERGVRFTRALTPSPVCAPARACLASGKEYDQCGVPNNKYDYPLDQPTYYQALRDAGYRVCGVGKFDLHKATHDWGRAGDRLLEEWGFTEGIDNEGKMDAIASGAESPMGPYMAYLHERGLAAAHVQDFRTRRNRGTTPTPLPDEAYCDNWIAANGLRFLEQFPSDQPWHLVVNFTGPHSPFDVTESMHRLWQDVRFPPPVESDQLDAQTHNAIRQNYAAMLENIDRLIGQFLDAVEARGEMDRTVIVYSSDHGEMLGDHNRWGKSTYYHASAGVPLIISGPDVQRGVVSEALVAVHDLAATFIEYAEARPLPEMDSRSLVPVLSGDRSSHREVVRSGLDSWRLVFDGRYKLARSEQEGETCTMLFDLERDPLERENIAATSPEQVSRLRAQL
ncbi:MAG TPA: sulfatase-like hydrolase/transferase [Chloroflexota bacterium]|nr:sulfatase-like hydrolase/transferase [Chloroflexota bacterium]